MPGPAKRRRSLWHSRVQAAVGARGLRVAWRLDNIAIFRAGAPWCLKVVLMWPSGVLWGALGVSWGPLGGPRWSFGWLVGGFLAPLVWPGAFFCGPRGFSRILVAFPRAGQKPSSKKRAVETQAGHTHTHTTSFTKPRFPFHDSQVYSIFARSRDLRCRGVPWSLF